MRATAQVLVMRCTIILPATLLLGLIGACTADPIPDTAIMPLTGGGTPIMSDVGAMQLSSYALGVPSRTQGDPVNGARAAASIDYLAGALYSNPHWDYMSVSTKAQMVRGRVEMRQVLGIDPKAPSQVVVDGLLAAAAAMDAHDIARADAALSGPAFTLGPGRTLAVLTDLPYMPTANVAAQRANLESTPRTGRCGAFPCS